MRINLKIKSKILASIIALVVVMASVIGFLAYRQANSALETTGKADLEHTVKQGLELCKTYNATAQENVKSSLNVAREIFYNYGGNRAQISENKLVLSGTGLDYIVNNDYEIVDKVQKLVGGTCTIFQVMGNEAVRISTNVLKENGDRAVGTRVSDEVYNQVVRQGKTFLGRAWVVNDWYITAYEPIKNGDGQIIGILYTGVQEKNSKALRDAILSVKIGNTGYLYTMDSKGTLIIHPTSEGKSIASNDFCKEMMAKAPSMSDGETGWIIYNSPIKSSPTNITKIGTGLLPREAISMNLQPVPAR